MKHIAYQIKSSLTLSHKCALFVIEPVTLFQLMGESGGDELGAAGAASHDELPTWLGCGEWHTYSALGPRRGIWGSPYGALYFDYCLDSTTDVMPTVCFQMV